MYQGKKGTDLMFTSIILICETFLMIGMYAFCVYLVNRVDKGCDAERRRAFESDVGPVTDKEWAAISEPTKADLDEYRRNRDMPF